MFGICACILAFVYDVCCFAVMSVYIQLPVNSQRILLTSRSDYKHAQFENVTLS